MTNNETKLLSKDETITTIRAGETPEIKFQDAIPQMLASCSMNLIVIQAGINMAFSAILIPQLSESASDIKIDLDSSSNLASIVTIFIAIGALTCGSLMDRFGRVRLAIFICVPVTAAWLLIVLSRNLAMIYLGRILGGFCSGVYPLSVRDCKLLIVIKHFTVAMFRSSYNAPGLTTVALVYVSEIACPKYRGMLLCLNSVAVSLGILLTYLLNIYFHWRTIGSIYAALSMATLFSNYWIFIFKRLW